MAKISARFETPNGRSVPRVDASINVHSSMFAGPGGTLDSSGNQGIGMQVRTEGGAYVWVYLTSGELAELNNRHAAFCASYPDTRTPGGNE